MKAIIFDFNRTLYNPDTNRLVPAALKVLRILKKRGYTLQLISRKESQRQQIIDAVGIAKYFTNILLTKEKTTTNFTTLAGTSRSVFVVGDRIREEIRIGNQLGYSTIWFKAGKFRSELPRNEKEEPKYVIKRLAELLKIIP